MLSIFLMFHSDASPSLPNGVNVSNKKILIVLPVTTTLQMISWELIDFKISHSVYDRFYFVLRYEK
jgi:hypothetical protein